ncbi:LysR family transcriptional regulator [Bordetella ansorpii]|uniref:LysR family transcriptional regulator n=1 Tax=Bordetella ansorpii TaxID=288768 RepID=A0A157P132_9BORD|nr:LysR family transcriptional regulator [Bordetella ansorpii]SAI27265.1 LysR family transcriptional regulator [Bordetella ansorpii]
MNFSFRQLRAFLAVASLGSFTRAAEQMHITQAGLSAMIRELEEQADCRLFERTTRAVRLTEAGLRLLPVAERAVRELGSTLGELGTLSAPAGRIKVGVTPLIACSVMPEVLRRFQLLLPDTRVDVADVDRSEIQLRVERGELDAGFGAFFSRVSGIRRSAVFPARLVLAVAHGQWKGKARARWDDIDPARLISLPADNAIQKMVDRHVGLADAGLRREATHLETVLAMVEAGLGHAVVPSFAAVAGRRWRVRLVPIEPVAPLDYYCITRAGRPELAQVAQLRDEFGTVALEYMRDDGTLCA